VGHNEQLISYIGVAVFVIYCVMLKLRSCVFSRLCLFICEVNIAVEWEEFLPLIPKLRIEISDEDWPYLHCGRVGDLASYFEASHLNLG
jgi:hypothetical protein